MVNPKLDRIVSTMPEAARQAVLADPKLAAELVRIYRQNPDRRGYRGEVRCQPSLAFSRGKMRRR